MINFHYFFSKTYYFFFLDPNQDMTYLFTYPIS